MSIMSDLDDFRLTRIKELTQQRDELLAACEAALPVVEAMNIAEHIMDGFKGRVPRPSDAMLARHIAAIQKARTP